MKIRGLEVADLVGPLDFDLAPGQKLGIIGESGSGKTLTALSLMGLQDLPVRGSIEFDGMELVGNRNLRRLRGSRITMVFQEPMSALDPLMGIGKQLRYAGVQDLGAALAEVGLDAGLARRYPHELSGGQRQRVCIAMAMAQRPDVLICDEPTTALDAASEEGILDLLDELVARNGTSLLFISHDLRVVARMCPEVLVMKDGKIVESGTLDDAQHPYTKALIAASAPKSPAPAAPLGPEVIRLEGAGLAARLHPTDLSVRSGERLGVVGGSGSGKTTLLKLIAGLEKPSCGEVHVDGVVQMVFQDPLGSLNPRLPIWRAVTEPLASPSRAKAAEALAEVGLGEEALDRYPHEFSGGQRQRISIARALVAEPDILLADEAVSALDVSVRAQVLELIEKIVAKRAMTLVFVSHDLDVVRQICTSLAVVDEGAITESGPLEEVWKRHFRGV